MEFRKDRNIFDAGYLDAMRAGNYQIDEAISELIDNSVDANSKKIEIILITDSKKKTQIDTIIVADNGNGMSTNQLDDALFIGNQTKTDNNLTGKYGQGLKSSTLKYCDRGTLYSKQQNIVSKATLNFHEIKNNNATINPPVKIEQSSVFENSKMNAIDIDIIKNSSYTIIFWENIIKENNNVDKSIESLLFNLGRKFRMYLESGTQIVIKVTGLGTNKKYEVKPIDPLKIDIGFEYCTPKPFIGYEQEDGFIIYTKIVNGKNIKLKIRFSQIIEEVYIEHIKNDIASDKNTMKNLNKLTGISFVRGSREVELKEKFTEFFKPKNEGAHKFIGCEIIYNPDDDDLFDSDAKKNSVNIPNTSILYDFFDKFVGKSFYDIQKRNTAIASKVSKEMKEKVINNSENKINLIKDGRTDYFIEDNGDTILINENSAIYKKTGRKIIELLVEDAQKNGDISHLKKINELLID